jgi:hypothetical protein
VIHLGAHPVYPTVSFGKIQDGSRHQPILTPHDKLGRKRTYIQPAVTPFGPRPRRPANSGAALWHGDESAVHQPPSGRSIRTRHGTHRQHDSLVVRRAKDLLERSGHWQLRDARLD